MKRKDLIREILRLGAVFKRHGAKHDIYSNSQKHGVLGVMTNNVASARQGRSVMEGHG